MKRRARRERARGRERQRARGSEIERVKIERGWAERMKLLVPRGCPAGGSDAAAEDGRWTSTYTRLASVHEVRPSVDLRFVSYLIIHSPPYFLVLPTAAGRQ